MAEACLLPRHSSSLTPRSSTRLSSTVSAHTVVIIPSLTLPVLGYSSRVIYAWSRPLETHVRTHSRTGLAGDTNEDRGGI